MRYHVSLKFVHWLTALIVIGMLASGFIMTDLDSKIYSIKWSIYSWHEDIGILVLLLTLLRLLLRNITNIPPLPSEFPKLIKFGANMMHYLFYLVLIAQPIFGYLMATFDGHKVLFFGIKLPALVESNKQFAGFAAKAHEITAFILITMVCLHVLVALKHRYIDKKDIIYRMI